MALRPELTLENYGTFSNEYTAFFNDSLQFRNNLIQLNSWIDYFLFKRSASNDVIVGDNGWLFYSKVADGDPIRCYKGTNLYSEEGLEAIAQNLIKQRDFLKEQGKEFAILIVPNKERIYPEYMPEKYGKVPADNYGVLQIYHYLSENTDLNVVYPYDELMDAKDKVSENIWYKTDTHWNFIGGYVGASALLEKLGIDMPKINDDEMSICEDDEFSGDLAGLLNLSKQLKNSDLEYSIEGYPLNNREELEWDYNGVIRYRATNADPRKLFLIRDSFGSQMALYMGSQFSESVFRNRFSYTYEDILEYDPDIVIYETVERYAGGLLDISIQ